MISVHLGIFTGYIGDGDGPYFFESGELPRWQGVERVQPDERTSQDGSASAAFSMNGGYLTGDTFVSGDLTATGDGPLLLPFDPELDGLLLHPRQLVLSMSLARDHQSVLSATLAGAFDVGDLARALLPLARARGYPPACGAGGEAALAALLVRAADLRFGADGAPVRDPAGLHERPTVRLIVCGYQRAEQSMRAAANRC